MDELEKLFIDKLNIKTTETIEIKEVIEPVQETIEIKEVIEPVQETIEIKEVIEPKEKEVIEPKAIKEPVENYRIKLLKNYINLSFINHDDEILKETTLKHAHIYCVINNINSQKYGCLIEKYIRIKHKFIKNNASNCNGDCSKDNKNIEIKSSLGGKNRNKFNWLQIRLYHDIQNYIFTAYYLNNNNVEGEGELFIFNIPKENIIDIILNYGSYAHGTKKEYGDITLEKLKNSKSSIEYALRPTYGDKLWNYILKYKIDEDHI